MAKAKSAVPQGLHTITPQLTLDHAAEAIDWYKKALGAEETSRATGPDGKIMHAELRIGRDVYWDGSWHERSDTRIPPGESVTMAR